MRQGIELQIQEGMDQGNIAPANAVDTTPRPNVDENLMNQYAAQAKNMLSIGEGGLDRIMLRSNTFIQGVATAGPNEATLNALLASQNGPRGLHGIPPGTVLHLRPLTDEERVALVEKLQIRDESKVAVGNE